MACLGLGSNSGGVGVHPRPSIQSQVTCTDITEVMFAYGLRSKAEQSQILADNFQTTEKASFTNLSISLGGLY